MTTRERVMELREQGLLYREIAPIVGISYSHAKRCGSPGTSYESNKTAAREAKRRTVGTCEGCGGPTRYNGHATRVSRFCVACNPGPKTMQARAGTFGRTADFLAFFTEPRRHSEFRDHFEISGSYASVFLNRAKKMGWLSHPERGVWVRP